jgi:hypothetical protein
VKHIITVSICGGFQDYKETFTYRTEAAAKTKMAQLRETGAMWVEYKIVGSERVIFSGPLICDKTE